jgi:hypothetical protein
LTRCWQNGKVRDGRQDHLMAAQHPFRDTAEGTVGEKPRSRYQV